MSFFSTVDPNDADQHAEIMKQEAEAREAAAREAEAYAIERAARDIISKKDENEPAPFISESDLNLGLGDDDKDK